MLIRSSMISEQSVALSKNLKFEHGKKPNISLLIMAIFGILTFDHGVVRLFLVFQIICEFVCGLF